ncbi:MAG: 6-phosphofructokinase [Deferribacterota bacterium]|nr:6-phosphofructokinase [Deferribacterota bacterium]
MRIGILTGGGDCPGLNPVIRAVVRQSINNGDNVLGIKYGWKGLLDKEFEELDLEKISGILPRGGTILRTSRTNPYKKEDGPERIKNNFNELGLDALIAVGGEDTLGVAYKLYKDIDLKVVGVPKTIDNDLSATDFTFGFDTSINIVTECIDRLHTTAESHNRIMIVEVMGRHAGWIATYGGLAGGADYILIPEIPIDIDDVVESIKRRHKRGKDFSIIVVAEGATFKEGTHFVQEKEVDEFGHVKLGGIGNTLGDLLKERLHYDIRVVVLGHIQRGGAPSAFDRILATRFGIKAYELVKDGKFGHMCALSGNKIIDVPLERAVNALKTVDMDIYNMSKIFFG